MNKIAKKVVLALFSLLISFSGHSLIPTEKLVGYYDLFKNDYKYLSFTYGLLALKSNIIKNIRFNGNFGPQNSKFLCHKQITHPAPGMEPNYADCPQDYTTAIIQHAFPSPAGNELTISFAKSDFFGQLTIEQIAQLLKRYVQKSVTQEFLISLGKKNKSAIGSSWKDAGLSDKPGTAFSKVIDHYFSMFKNAADEAELYPYKIIEATLIALALNKANTIADLKPFLEEIKEYRDNFSEPKIYNIKDYIIFKENYVQEDKIDPAQFENLLKQNPQDIIYLTLAYGQDNKSGYVSAPIVGFSKSVYENQEFNDCGESSLRNFFNLILSRENQSFDTSELEKAFPNISLKLLKFYKEHQPTFADVNNENARLQWAKVVSGLEESRAGAITYSKGGICDISGIGLDNIIKVLKTLFNDDSLYLISDNKEALDFIFKKASYANVIFDWVKDDDYKNIDDNYLDLYVLINGYKSFKWEFSHGHYLFLPIENDDSLDWRKNSGLEIPLLQSINIAFKNGLIPFYIVANPQIVNSINNNFTSDDISKITPSIFYGSKFIDSDERFNAIMMLLNLKSFSGAKLAKIVLPKWYGSFSPREREISLYSLKKKFSESEWLDYIKQHNVFTRYRRTEFPNFPAFLREPWAETLFIDAIENSSFKAEEEKELLFAAIKNGRFPIARALLHKYPHYKDENEIRKYLGELRFVYTLYDDNLDKIIFLLDEFPRILEIAMNEDRMRRNLLHKSIDENNTNLTKFLLNKKPELAREESTMRDKQGYTPLHLAAREGNLEVVKLLLELNPALVDISNDHKSTALEEAVDANKPEIVKYLLEKYPAMFEKIFKKEDLINDKFSSLAANEFWSIINIFLKYIDKKTLIKTYEHLLIQPLDYEWLRTLKQKLEDQMRARNISF